jgi:S1-C subfamily serine protease
LIAFAASAFVACLASASDSQLTADELSQWSAVAPSVAVILQNRIPQGAAVLIDADGWFLAHRCVVPAPYVWARLASGRNIQLKVVTVDDGTQLVLLKAVTWSSDMGTPVKTAGPQTKLKPGDLLFLVIASGVVRAQFSNGDLCGVNGPNHRFMPLSEIRFEAPANRVGGGLVFTKSGELIGVMQATLGGQESKLAGALSVNAALSVQQNAGTVQGGALGGGGLGGGKGDEAGTHAEDNAIGFGGRGAAPSRQADSLRLRRLSGPQAMTVAFCIDHTMLSRALQGFLSPSHEVVYPTLGVYCNPASGGGALIMSVQQGSTAEKGGLQAGDVMTELAGIKISNQFDFARAMARQEVGKTIQIKVMRGGVEVQLDVTVGSGITRLVPSP